MPKPPGIRASAKPRNYRKTGLDEARSAEEPCGAAARHEPLTASAEAIRAATPTKSRVNEHEGGFFSAKRIGKTRQKGMKFRFCRKLP